MTPEPTERPYTVTTSGPGQVVWHNGADGTTAAELVAHQDTGSALPTAADRARDALALTEALAELLGDDSRCDLAIGNVTVQSADAIAPTLMGEDPCIGVELTNGRRYLLTVEAVDE